MEEIIKIREMETAERTRDGEDRNEECMLSMIRAIIAQPTQPNNSHPSRTHLYNPQPHFPPTYSSSLPILLLIIEMISITWLSS